MGMCRVSNFVAEPTVAEFFRSNADNRILIGPLGSGKSSACTIEILRRAQMQEPGADSIRHTRFAVIRNTYRELTDTTKATMTTWLPPEITVWVESDMTFWLKFNDVECEILLRALDRPDDVKKLLSLDLTAAWVNEAKEVPKSVFDMLQGRIGRFPNSEAAGYCTWCGVFMDTNPPDSDHWIYKTFEEFDKIDIEDRPNFRVFHQPSGLAPNAENISNLLRGQRKADGRPLYYAKMMPGKTKAWLDAFIHGRYSFVADGKAVYPEFFDEVHVAKTELEWRAGLILLLGMDFGLTPALVIAQCIPGLLQWQVLDEITSDDMGAQRFAKHALEYLKSKYPGAKFRGWGDPSGDNRAQTDETTPFTVVQSAGLPIDPAPTNDPIRRREAVVGQLSTLGMTGQPSLIISPRAKKLRKGMGGGYHYARVQVSGEERYRDEPVKNTYSHVCEALQYLMVGEGMDYKALDQGKSEEDRPQRPKVKMAINRRSPNGPR
jgi:hypothetical protein